MQRPLSHLTDMSSFQKYKQNGSVVSGPVSYMSYFADVDFACVAVSLGKIFQVLLIIRSFTLIILSTLCQACNFRSDYKLIKVPDHMDIRISTLADTPAKRTHTHTHTQRTDEEMETILNSVLNELRC